MLYEVITKALIDIYENMDSNKKLSIIAYYRNDQEMCLFA